MPQLGPRLSDSYISLEHHQPKRSRNEYHFHASIEINYLSGCDMTYSFSGEPVTIRDGCFTIFWAAYPHRPVNVSADGTITNAYVALSEFLRWPLPDRFVNELMNGAVLSTRGEQPGDEALALRWARERHHNGPDWQSMHAMEIQARLLRMSMEGWDRLYSAKKSHIFHSIGGNAILHFEQMLRFIGANYSEGISTKDVAKAAGVSQNYAMSLFKRMLGQSIKEHVTEMRIVHAKTLLTNTDKKILTIAMDCGFGSLSSFYEAFGKQNGMSPAAFRNGVKSNQITV